LFRSVRISEWSGEKISRFHRKHCVLGLIEIIQNTGQRAHATKCIQGLRSQGALSTGKYFFKEITRLRLLVELHKYFRQMEHARQRIWMLHSKYGGTPAVPAPVKLLRQGILALPLFKDG
jgi:hypothetical protein